MHPSEFAAKWRELAPRLSERATYQEHWRDVCALLGEPTPSSDLTGDNYAFEKHVKKAGTGETGFADVFLRDHLVAEYKAQGRSLGKALQQALLYARELGNPPLLVVSDLSTIEIHTNFTASSPRTIRITLDDIERDAPVGGDLTALSALHALFRDPGKLDPRQLRERVTQDATARIGQVAQALTARGTSQVDAAHFLMRLVFAMFSEDVGLLPRGLLTRVLKRAREHPERSQGYFQELFTAMRQGGEFWGEDVRHFNGGLFDSGFALPITREDADALLAASTLDWAQVEPAIFGTLFENSLDAVTRSKRGAHYTAVRDIVRVTDPVIMQPLRREWEAVKAQAEALSKKLGGKQAALEVVQAFHARLGRVTVLDPACGSGNFLVVALGQLLDLEQEVRSLGWELGAGPFAMPPQVHPRQLQGIEVEAFAHELASVSVWIAFFQWKAAHGGEWETPVLQRLDNIRHGDALLNLDGTKAPWPDAEFIIGNPPFLGGKLLRTNLGDEYVDRLFRAYSGEVARESDLVCYWFERARQALHGGVTRRVGLVTTNSIRGGANRQVLGRIQETGALFNAWNDEPWLQDGAAVRVSLVCFDGGEETVRALNGQPVAHINPDLTASTDVTAAQPLPENAGLSFMGTTKGGPFDIPGDVARRWLALPNPDGVNNADVVKPWVNGLDLTRRPRNMWVVDFGLMPEAQASQYFAPFEYVREHVLPARQDNKRESYRRLWWLHAEPRPAMRQAFTGLSRYIGTPRVAKHRLFVWLPVETVPDSQVIVFARDDDFTFGVLHSRAHEVWSLRQGTALGVGNDPRYTPSTCFETFPFPAPTAEQQAEVEKWARYVVQMREHLLAQDGRATLTSLYNAVAELRRTPDTTHPAHSLLTAHNHLDAAVAAASRWLWPLEEDEVLARLLALNEERVKPREVVTA
ncbi:class I SAM-dependent DNA methyltransferase [Deinococcus planocerae]|uniref:class I SAM-dependent DNA methyltransferase n=1 Tax=Deinococcus planocerae TaxID=1737569 RepID=UPI0015E126E1|nr:class I SAM-dependent DNA methyltransferase [Deinococcus planocerae]